MRPMALAFLLFCSCQQVQTPNNDSGVCTLGKPARWVDVSLTVDSHCALEAASGSNESKVWCWKQHHTPPAEGINFGKTNLQIRYSAPAAHALAASSTDVCVAGVAGAVCMENGRWTKRLGVGVPDSLKSNQDLVCGSFGELLYCVGSATHMPFVKDPVFRFPHKIKNLTMGIAGACVVLDNGSVQCIGEIFDKRPGWNEIYPKDVLDVALTMEQICVMDTNHSVSCSKKDVSISDVTKISGGLYQICAVSRGDVFCWGDSVAGELGTGEGKKSSPQPARIISGAADIWATNLRTCARTDANIIYCWGEDIPAGEGQSPSPKPVCIH